MRAVCMQKNARFARVGPKTRAAEHTKNKWNQDFQDMGFFFSARRVRSSLTMKNTARYRSAGACPPHSHNPTKNIRSAKTTDVFQKIKPGEGQALALR